MQLNIYFMLIIISLIIDALLYFCKYQMYYKAISICKFTRYNIVSIIEQIAYLVERHSRKIPYLIICPNRFRLECLAYDMKYSISKGEKVIIRFEIFVVFNRQFIGIRITYVICFIIFLEKMYTEIIGKVISFIKDGLNSAVDIDYIDLLQNVYVYVIKNGSALLIILLCVVIIYNSKLKKDVAKLKFEGIWEETVINNMADIANHQHKINQKILLLYKAIQNNVYVLKSIISALDHYIAYSKRSDDDFINMQKRSLKTAKNLKEYSVIINEIKDTIKTIEEKGGRKLYQEYNNKMWYQLDKLSLTDSSKTFIDIQDITDCEKKVIERIIEGFNPSEIEAHREEFLHSWHIGISCLNGIQRYVRYVSKRIKMYGYLNRKIGTAVEKKEILEKIKEVI